MPDRGAVDRAVFAMLKNDPTLTSLLPDGVYRDNAPQGKTRVTIMMTPTHLVTDLFHGIAFETYTYLVKALCRDNSVTTADNAAARIDDLMTTAVPTPTGYVVEATRLDERIAYGEPDPNNPDQMWQHRGGLYHVIVTPA